MVDLTGHETGNGGYSQRTPTALPGLLYSEPRLAVLCGHFASELGELLFRIREILLIELQARFEQWNVRGRGCLSPADLAGIHLYGRWDDFGRILPTTDR